MESKLRSFVKALLYRVLGSVVVVVISFFITNNKEVAFNIGIAEFVSKILIYYFYERIWSKIPWGRKKVK